jgi:hypothetical protein
MQNIVRIFIVVLAVTGAAASTQISSANTSKVTIAKTSALPIPMCAPDDPNACGITGGHH